MTPLSEPNSPSIALQASAPEATSEAAPEKILCQHCKRTARNGIKCQGMCVADSDY